MTIENKQQLTHALIYEHFQLNLCRQHCLVAFKINVG